jgi:hypothetical protein
VQTRPHELASALRRILARQRADVLARLKTGGTVNLSDYDRPMADQLAPLLEPYFLRGGRDAIKTVAVAVSRASRKGRRLQRQSMGTSPALEHERLHEVALRSDVPRSRRARNADNYAVPLQGNLAEHWPAGATLKDVDPYSPSALFRRFFPRVKEAVWRLTYAFVRKVNQTSKQAVNIAVRLFRGELAQGLEQGESNQKLAKRLDVIFRDPKRSLLIARTEASNAIHSGQATAAEESGVAKGLEWLAAPDCCEFCCKLDGQQVRFGETFTVTIKNKTLSAPHPTLHPRCRCTTKVVLKSLKEVFGGTQ